MYQLGIGTAHVPYWAGPFSIHASVRPLFHVEFGPSDFMPSLGPATFFISNWLELT